MTRVLFRIGFHKTGTTSANRFLQDNRGIIEPHAALMLHRETRPITRWVSTYRQLGDPAALQVLQDDLEGAFAALSLQGRDLIISDEDFLGSLPLGDGPDPYPDAARLVAVFRAAMRALPQPVQLTLSLSMRATPDWAQSVHAHLVRKLTRVRMTEDATSFTARLIANGPETTVAAIRAAHPDLHLQLDRMDDLLPQRHGLGQPFVDFLDLPQGEQARLTPAGHHLRGQSAQMTERLLQLNRSDLDDDALAAAKKSLLQAARDEKKDMAS